MHEFYVPTILTIIRTRLTGQTGTRSCVVVYKLCAFGMERIVA